MTLLIFGLLLWVVAHLFKRVAPAGRLALTNTLGEGSKGVFALMITHSSPPGLRNRWGRVLSK